MKKTFSFLVLSAFLVAAGGVYKYQLSPAKGYPSEAKKLDDLFARYCKGAERLSTQIPYPNYSSNWVKRAAVKLNTVAPVSFYMYGGVISSYGFRKGRMTEEDASKPIDQKRFWAKYGDILEKSGNRSFGEKKNWDTGESEFDEEYLKKKFDYEYFSQDSRPPKQIKVDGKTVSPNGNTHAFLVYLCGEFRDRPSLIAEKLEWIHNMIKLPAKAQPAVTAQQVKQEGKSIWQYVTAPSYAYYVSFSRLAFAAKEDKAWAENRTMPLSEKWNVDKPVPAFDVCEVKYMMTEYVFKYDTSVEQDIDDLFPGYEQYMDGLAQYRSSYCSEEDNNFYYDFRGDSNMKPNSPESNGMIWYATSIMNRCRRDAKGNVSVATDRATGEQLDFDVKLCEKYMSAPFENRWNAARAALTTWTMRNEKFDGNFSDTRSLVSIIPSKTPELYPFSFQFYGEEIYQGSNMENFMEGYQDLQPENWLSPDSGFNYTFGVTDFDDAAATEQKINYAYERLKDAVDRHTDWYASGYNDSFFEPVRARQIEQAYSPFVASSYEMSESDAFTAPGITVNGPVDGRRQWMFVFKVEKDKWYNTDHIKEGKPIDFERHWLDETSFGTTHLADTERAWDRLGTPLEGEMESIIYLHNIKNQGSAIKNMGMTNQYPAVEDDGLGATHE